VSVRAEGGGPTIAERRDAHQDAARAEARDLPLVQAVLTAFPDARITVREPGSAAEAAPVEDDDWDPLEL
jgi:DNA polymerase-3 subunit gamma/tau